VVEYGVTGGVGDKLYQVIRELKKVDVEHVIPINCSGKKFIGLAQRKMRGKLVRMKIAKNRWSQLKRARPGNAWRCASRPKVLLRRYEIRTTTA
jgi:hypothetical protein